jgi:branched-chain amino acid transport system permease protein
MLAFAIGVSLAAAGGPLFGMLFAFYPATHWLWIGKLLAIVVLGGMGSLTGTFVAAMILGLAEQVAVVFMPLDWAPLVFYGVLFGILIVRPQGLFGATARESL